MPSTARFAERIGKVFLPEADPIDNPQEFTPNPDDPFPEPIPGRPPKELLDPRLPRLPLELGPFPRICRTRLKRGCYTVAFTPKGTSIFGTRFVGTLRVETLASGLRFSGDLYTRRLLDDILVKGLFELSVQRSSRDLSDAGTEAADTGGTIPIFARRRYHSYLKGTSAGLFAVVQPGCPCRFSLSFDEFVYNQPATGFNGSFNTTRTRAIRFALRHTSTADLFTGEAFDGTTLLGSVSIRWISDFFRRAHIQLNTLSGAETPPASVGTSTMTSIFADAGWDVGLTDAGTVTLPAALSGININTCWALSNLHTLMSSVPGYNAADLDTVWRVHLLSVPATLGCSRGFMFDSGGDDLNAIGREGSATFSRDGYPASETPDGSGGSHYDTAANQQARNVPRAWLRSATHEMGHAFNQIHQGFESGNDNSIMTPTNSCAIAIGLGGTFPDDINLGFNATVTAHLRHLPDPAVRPGAMDFFGSAISAPQAADVAWVDSLVLSVDTTFDKLNLGEPTTLTFEIKNTSEVPIPVPAELDLPSLTVRVSVTDPSGKITFIRPASVLSCPELTLVELQPGKTIKGSTTLFWGSDGFAFETPGRHVVEVIVLWDIGGVPVGTSGECPVFVNYPVSETDNDVAALLLDPDVGRAIATKRAWAFAHAKRRIEQAIKLAPKHRAVTAVKEVAVLSEPVRGQGGERPRKTAAAKRTRKRK